MELALSDVMLEFLREKLAGDPSLSAEERDQEMRKAAMALSVGGIGPLLKERIIEQSNLGADVVGVSLLYNAVWVQKIEKDLGLKLNPEEVTQYLKKVLQFAGELAIDMYDGKKVKVTVWKAPQGAYGKASVYFLDVPNTDLSGAIGGTGNVMHPGAVVYPGRRDITRSIEAGTEAEKEEVKKKEAAEIRNQQSWILGRGALALMKELEKKN